MKWVKRFFLFLLFAILLAGGAGFGVAWLSLPKSVGEITLAGLQGPVTVARDENGVPTIRSGNSRDAYFALGFVHAQDRLWQMEMTRRVGAGRLSEIIGGETLGMDRFMRTMGFYALAERQASGVSGETKLALSAYASGVNAYLDQDGLVLPPEFLILGHEPEPWQLADSIVWSKLMAFQLSNNWRSELLNLALSRKLPVQELQSLFPGRDEPAVITGAARSAIDFARRLLDELPQSLQSHSASNAWILDGSRTESGLPVLANDPHLRFSSPILWYLARLETPDWEMTGVTVPGVPIHVLGHNGHLAWGLTTTHADTQDIVFEEVPERGSNSITLTRERGVLTRREEVINIKGEAPVRHAVWSMPGAVVISDVLDELKAALPDHQIARLVWPGFLEDDETVSAVLAMNRAKDLSAFQQALGRFHSPIQNIHYADRRGNIALFVPGRIPVRNGDGTYPAQGENPASQWNGYIPQDQLPRVINPPSGLIVNANNRLVPKDYPYLITAVWPASYRADRIVGVLEGAREGADLALSASLQNDVVALPAKALNGHLVASLARSGREELVGLMDGWDFRMAADRPEAALYAVWERRLLQTILADELEEEFGRFWRSRPRLLERLMREESAWCDKGSTDDREDCAAMSDLALEAAMDDLEDWLGEDWRHWRWGDLHQGRFDHDIFKHIPVADRVFGRRIATAGGDETVDRGQTGGGGVRRSYDHVHGAGYRAIYDLSNLANSRYALAGGQSGHPLSPWFASLLDEWNNGLYVTFGQGAMEKLSLLPEAGN
ncbi:penicillin acylase family protein [Aestuariispira insulae]|uniref:Penicillin amidase n=1 Tax=Aestuariispira insulae TaxID=1461337 RepID=A0A3D9HVS2_9PROT|nr:penicillin acylase family protein [Aestuariispira insulae]RED53614.1 penicillin amidase [Aestuariispira insulae]